MSSQTILGRIQPIFRGTYDSTTTYNKLDNVFYNGNTWVCQLNEVINITPSEGSSVWQLVAKKGDQGIQGNTGSFGAPTATATTVRSGGAPTVSVSASGPDTAKVFNFQFGIPEGPYGFDDVSATASGLPAGSNPTVISQLNIVGNERSLSFAFGIPAADGTGAKSVDNINADSGGNVPLHAVQYEAQSLSSTQKTQACQNINAMEIPLGGATNNVLRKLENGYGWSSVSEIPSGGENGSILSKSGTSSYVWMTAITDTEIDSIIAGTVFSGSFDINDSGNEIMGGTEGSELQDAAGIDDGTTPTTPVTDPTG